jgi:arylsulfatase A-like enzyme
VDAPGRFVRALALLAALSIARGAAAAPAPPVPAAGPVAPNVVLIVIDDMGWADSAVYGSRFYETPAIDTLARQGARFTNFYAAGSVCSPTRASLMTGQYPARIGITDWIGGDDTGAVAPPKNRDHLPLEHETIGEAFAAAGYATGYIGKWHLGTGAYMPAAQGFAFTKAVNNAGQPAAYFFPYRDPKWEAVNIPDLDDGREGDYLTDRLTDEAVGFIERQQSRPFFLVVSHYAVHTPLQSKTDLSAKYSTKAAALFGKGPAPGVAEHEATTRVRQDDPVYAAMIESVDQSVGRIRAALDRLRLTDRTVVVFMSDNGGLSTLAGTRVSAPTANAPLRAGKGWLYEGGIRVPAIVTGPGVRAGRVIDVPTVSTDLYPTLLALAGLPARPAQHLDGASLQPLLAGGSRLVRDAIFWHFPHYHGSGNRPSSAIRMGDWKLIEWLEDGRLELYNVAGDPGESRDLATPEKATAARLKARLDAWRTDVRAAMPARR